MFYSCHVILAWNYGESKVVSTESISKDGMWITSSSAILKRISLTCQGSGRWPLCTLTDGYKVFKCFTEDLPKKMFLSILPPHYTRVFPENLTNLQGLFYQPPIKVIIVLLLAFADFNC